MIWPEGLAPSYVVVGHLTHDSLPAGGYQVGGTATYAAIAAQRLGMFARVLTSAVPSDCCVDALSSIEVVCRPARFTTKFENTYLEGHRRQRLLAVAESLTSDDLPPAWACSEVVHLGPVAREVAPDMVDAFTSSLVGITPQGWLRTWDDAGVVASCEWPNARALLSSVDIVVMSADDLFTRHDLHDYVRWARALVLTVGNRGAIVYHGGREEHVTAFDVREVDPTGAGDVFAAVCLVRLYETGDLVDAVRYANCAASFVVEGVGIAGIPTREAIEDRLAHGQLRI